MLDPDHPTVQLCARGMQAEAAGDFEAAQALFQQAWDSHQDVLGACVAAHYLARHQDTPQDTLRWNLVAWERAEHSTDEQVLAFKPSLLLNLGWSHELLGQPEVAHVFHQRAWAEGLKLPPSPYAAMTLDAIRLALLRTQSKEGPL